MLVREMLKILEGELLVGEHLLDLDVQAAFGADMMSDVMAYAKENVVLLTGLINSQSIRTADLMDIKVIVYVRGKTPTPDMVAEAKNDGLAILTTRHSMYVSCGRLYEAGLREGGMRG